RLALDELHREEHVPTILPNIVDLSDVGMVERGRGARLSDEPGAGVLVRHQIAGENLQGQIAVEARVVGSIDYRHSAGAWQAREAVVRYGLFEKFVHGGFSH